VAKKIGAGYQTMLRWLYAKKLAEPERKFLGGASIRLWTEAELPRARSSRWKAQPRDAAGRYWTPQEEEIIQDLCLHFGAAPSALERDSVLADCDCDVIDAAVEVFREFA
jgi:hypothetical protein